MARKKIRALAFQIGICCVGFLLTLQVLAQDPTAASAASPKYPVVVEVQGAVVNISKDSVTSKVKVKEVLRERAHLKIEGDGQVRIQLDPVRQFVLLSDSELMIPAISWETGDAPVLNLKSGSLHWKQDITAKAPYNVALTSALFQFMAPPGDYVIGLSPKAALTFLKVYEGQLVFSALNSEETAKVRSGQQVEFQGVLEEGEISYDVLLKGKRIPKGKLSNVTSLDKKELSAFEKEEAAKRARAVSEKRRQQEKASKAQAEGQICQRPLGKLNQCAWTSAKKGKGLGPCSRQRCNANGVWAEKTELSAAEAAAKCRAGVVVAECDY